MKNTPRRGRGLTRQSTLVNSSIDLFASLFRSSGPDVGNAKTVRSHRNAASHRPHLEMLERREMLAAELTAVLSGDALRIEGAEPNDSIIVQRIDDRFSVNQLLIADGSLTVDSVSASRIDRIEIVEAHEEDVALAANGVPDSAIFTELADGTGVITFDSGHGVAEDYEIHISVSKSSHSRLFYATAESPTAEINNLRITSVIDEGGIAVLTGDIVVDENQTDSGESNEVVVSIDWGDDSTIESFTYPAGTATFSESHRYDNEEPVRKSLTRENFARNDSYIPIGSEFHATPNTESPLIYNHHVANDSNGNSLVVWTIAEQEDNRTVYNLYGRRIDASGNSLNAPFKINSYSGSTLRSPSIDFSSDGSFAVVWTGNYAYWQLPSNEAGMHVRGRRFDASGNPIGDEFQVNTTKIPTTYESPGARGTNWAETAVAVDQTGNVIVAWSYNETTGRIVRSQVFDSAGQSVGEEYRVNVQTNAGDSEPNEYHLPYGELSLHADDSGVVSIFWTDRTTGPARLPDGSLNLDYRIMRQRYDVSRQPLGAPQQIEMDRGGVARTAADAEGNFVVVESNSKGITGQRYASDGSPIGETFRVADGYLVNSSSATVAMAPSGEFIVSWSDNYPVSGRGYWNGVKVQPYDAQGRALGRPFMVNPDDPNLYVDRRSPGRPALAMDDSGNLTVAYFQRNPGVGYRVSGQRFAVKDPDTTAIEVRNVAAKLNPLWLSSESINENDSIAVQVNFVDPGRDVHSVLLDWGDGTQETFDLPADGRDITLTHAFPDDGLSEPHSRDYSVTATVIDDGVHDDSSTRTITVNNIVPVDAIPDPDPNWPDDGSHSESDPLTNGVRDFRVTVIESNFEIQNAIITSAIDENGTANFSGDIVASDGVSVPSITVDWGDGTAPEIFNFTADTARFEVSHDYLNNDPVVSDGNRSFDNQGGSSFAPIGPRLAQDICSNCSVRAKSKVVLRDDGSSVMVWLDRDSTSKWNVYAQRYDAAGNSVGDRFRVNTYPTGSRSHREIFANVDASGNLLVAWESGDYPNHSEYGRTIHAQRYDADFNTLGGEFELKSEADPIGKSLKAMDMDEQGNFVILFAGGRPYDQEEQFFGQAYDANGHPRGNSFQVTNNRYPGFLLPIGDVKMDAAGNFIVAWSEYDESGGFHTIYAQIYNPLGVPANERLTVRSGEGGDFAVGHPSLSVADEGDFVVTWPQYMSYSPFQRDIIARRYDAAGAAQGDPFRVSRQGMDRIGVPSVVIDDDGGMVFAWQGRVQSERSGSRIYLQRFDAEGRMVGREYLASHDSDPRNRDSGDHAPFLAINDDGDVFVAYYRRYDGIFAQRFTRSANESFDVTVQNVSPRLNPLALSSASIGENDTVTLSGSFADPGTLDEHTVIVDWGDGHSETVSLADGGRAFSLSHQYLDDPAGAAPSEYTIRATVTDHQSASDSAETTITVNDLPPQITSVISSVSGSGSSVGDENETITVTGSFSNPGTLDTHSVTIDWGDGTTTHSTDDASLSVTESDGSGSFSASHVYLEGGRYTVHVTVTDDDGSAVTEETRSIINGVGLQPDGTLHVVGKPFEDNTVSIQLIGDAGAERLLVDASFLTGIGQREFALSSVSSMEMLFGSGEDTVTISDDILLPATIDAGDGDDHIRGGGGDDFIAGRDGNDRVEGGGGDDTYLYPQDNDTYIFAGVDLGSDTIEPGLDYGPSHPTPPALTFDFTGMSSGVTFDTASHEWQDVNSDLRLKLIEDDVIWAGSPGFPRIAAEVLIWTVHGSKHNDQISGDYWTRQIFGNEGDDTLIGRTASLLEGGKGDDTLEVQGNHGTLRGGANNDTLISRGNNNELLGEHGSDTFHVHGMNSKLDGGPGGDTYFFTSDGYSSNLLEDLFGPDTLDFSISSAPINIDLDLTLSVAKVIGTPFDDVIVGNHLANELQGGDGHDRLFGGSGQDILLGGEGNDTIHGGPDEDLLDGGTGADVLQGDSGIDQVFAGSDQDIDVTVGADGDDIVGGQTVIDHQYDWLIEDPYGNRFAQTRDGEVRTQTSGEQQWGHVDWIDQSLGGAPFWLRDQELYQGSTLVSSGIEAVYINDRFIYALTQSYELYEYRPVNFGNLSHRVLTYVDSDVRSIVFSDSDLYYLRGTNGGVRKLSLGGLIPSWSVTPFYPYESRSYQSFDTNPADLTTAEAEFGAISFQLDTLRQEATQLQASLRSLQSGFAVNQSFVSIEELITIGEQIRRSREVDADVDHYESLAIEIGDQLKALRVAQQETDYSSAVAAAEIQAEAVFQQHQQGLKADIESDLKGQLNSLPLINSVSTKSIDIAANRDKTSIAGIAKFSVQAQIKTGFGNISYASSDVEIRFRYSTTSGQTISEKAVFWVAGNKIEIGLGGINAVFSAYKNAIDNIYAVLPSRDDLENAAIAVVDDAVQAANQAIAVADEVLDDAVRSIQQAAFDGSIAYAKFLAANPVVNLTTPVIGRLAKAYADDGKIDPLEAMDLFSYTSGAVANAILGPYSPESLFEISNVLLRETKVGRMIEGFEKAVDRMVYVPFEMWTDLNNQLKAFDSIDPSRILNALPDQLQTDALQDLNLPSENLFSKESLLGHVQQGIVDAIGNVLWDFAQDLISVVILWPSQADGTLLSQTEIINMIANGQEPRTFHAEVDLPDRPELNFSVTFKVEDLKSWNLDWYVVEAGYSFELFDITYFDDSRTSSESRIGLQLDAEVVQLSAGVEVGDLSQFDLTTLVGEMEVKKSDDTFIQLAGELDLVNGEDSISLNASAGADIIGDALGLAPLTGSYEVGGDNVLSLGFEPQTAQIATALATVGLTVRGGHIDLDDGSIGIDYDIDVDVTEPDELLNIVTTNFPQFPAFDPAGATVTFPSANEIAIAFEPQTVSVASGVGNGSATLSGLTFDLVDGGVRVDYDIEFDLSHPEQLIEYVSNQLLVYPAGGEIQIQSNATPTDLNGWLQAIAALPDVPVSQGLVTIALNLGTGQYVGPEIFVPDGYRLILDGANQAPIIVGASPSITLLSGDLSITGGVTLTNETDSPTVLVNQGKLTLRNTVVEETNVADRPAIQVTNGSVDLGTPSQPGGNTITIRGRGNLVTNSSVQAIFAVGNTFKEDDRELESNFEIEQKIVDAADDSGGGKVTVVPDSFFFTIDEGVRDFNLRALSSDVEGQQSTFEVVAPIVGVAQIQSDGHTVRFTSVDDGETLFQFTVSEAGETGTTRTIHLNILNRDPTLASVSEPVVTRDGFTSVTGKIVDPGSDDTHSVLIDWGDGTTSQASVDPVTRIFSASHQYVPESDGKLLPSYDLSLTVTDDDGGTGSLAISATLEVPSIAELTDFDVQRGASGRSFVRYLDLTFANAQGLDDLLDASRLQLIRYGLDGSGGTDVSLDGLASANDHQLTLDFGPQGIGGNRNANLGDGYYELNLDLDGDGVFETTRSFHRLFGDVNGDRHINALDWGQILSVYGTVAVGLDEDVNGDGVVNALDRVFSIRANGRSLADELVIDD